MTPQEFVSKWKYVELKERSASQEHFIDLCRLVDHPTPTEFDPKGERFCFEKGVEKKSGGKGWADVWYKGHFAWEYKGKRKDLDSAYHQLLQYRESLENPWLLIVSDMDCIIIHTNFHNAVKRIYEINLDDLLDSEKLELLRLAFHNPIALKAEKTVEQVTEEAAREFAHLADLLRKWGEEPSVIAHFLIRLLFCLFAEDIGLLPKDLFTRLTERTRRNSKAFASQLQQLFKAMQSGGWFGADEIVNFDGGLFDDDTVLELDSEGMNILVGISGLDWSSIEPSIIGTLFERSLDPSKKAQLGAHYTSREDILLIVEPVLMAPLRRRWEEVKTNARDLADELIESKGGNRKKYRKQLSNLLTGFSTEISETRVLDPACGSGNFLYVALRQLLDLEKEVVTLAGDLGIGRSIPQVSPKQLFGIEINAYAHELAQATVWIGYIQWLHENGFGTPSEPILEPLNNIKKRDAILGYTGVDQPIIPPWPEVDVIVSNPPFLGGNRIRQELGDEYVELLFGLYKGRLSAFSDLVCYWFEQARFNIEQGNAIRAGMLATNSIRDGVNRDVLKRIKNTGDIFMAWCDRAWILDGANVRVSIVAFDNGENIARMLDGKPASNINADLSGNIDYSAARPLIENANHCFYGSQQKGSFNISPSLATSMISQKNAFGRSNKDVIKYSVNAARLMRRSPETWVIDFGETMTINEASMYEAPFEYVKKVVLPERKNRREKRQREKWWLHARPSPRYREILEKQSRYIVTPSVSKHRVFDWLANNILADHRLLVFASEDDYFLGVLQSLPHELWALRMGSTLEDRPAYTPSTTFETFPFPMPPGQEFSSENIFIAITEAAHDLVEKRSAWLNLDGLQEDEKRNRTLTKLYNRHPTWLELAHKKLNEAVFAAYGWPDDLEDSEILERLLELNLLRSKEDLT